MLFKFLVPRAVVAAVSVRAISTFDFPTTIARAEIPDGVTVYEYNDTAATMGAAAAPRLRSLEGRDDCKGSWMCRSISASACKNAHDRFDPKAYYCGYASRVSSPGHNGGCTAIYRCWQEYKFCRLGAELKAFFERIYIEQKCGVCGSHDIEMSKGFNCQVTYNYCWHCNDVG